MAFDKPQSRNEAILQNMLGANNELEPPKSRVEALLQDIAGQMPEANPSEGTTTGTLERLKIGNDIYTVEGGGSGTSDYDALNNKPQIAGVTLSGDKSLADLGIASATDLSSLSGDVSAIKDGQTIDSFADVESALADKVDKVAGKGLSTNDYTNEDKAIVGGVTAALAGKQNVLTAGSNIKIDNNTISVNRWAVPAGKVVYTVITSDENYGQNVHVQRHTLGGSFIDDRTFLCEMYKTVNIDGLISIYNPYSSFRITLLENSDEQQAGYNYTVSPITTPTSNSFTFLMEQEENANDLIIRSELDTAINAIKDGTSIDSFADVETALATKADLTDLAPAFSTATAYTVGKYVSYGGNIYKCTSAHSAGAWAAGDFTLVAVGSELESKQNATDNNLQTTDKTVVGAINSLKSGLTNYEATTNAALALPENTGKNVLPYTLTSIKQNNSSGTWVDNAVTINGVTFTITASGDKVTKISATRVSASESNAILELVDYAAKTGDILSGCPIGGSNTTYKVYCRGGSTGDFGEGATIAEGDVGVSRRYSVAVFSTSSPTDLEFYPMIRPATITDPTFAPYIPSVESRIEAVENNKQDTLPITFIKGTADPEDNTTYIFNTTVSALSLFIFFGQGVGSQGNNGKGYIFTVASNYGNSELSITKIAGEYDISRFTVTKTATGFTLNTGSGFSRTFFCVKLS